MLDSALQVSLNLRPSFERKPRYAVILNATAAAVFD
jgi:hypothetical protein